MKLGELKKSLSRFPPDMDDMEILIQYVNADGSEDVDLLLYVAYAQFKENVFAICLGTWKKADILIEKGRANVPIPEGYTPHPLSKTQNSGSTYTYER
jgi:hypothetical protein